MRSETGDVGQEIYNSRRATVHMRQGMSGRGCETSVAEPEPVGAVLFGRGWSQCEGLAWAPP